LKPSKRNEQKDKVAGNEMTKEDKEKVAKQLVLVAKDLMANDAAITSMLEKSLANTADAITKKIIETIKRGKTEPLPAQIQDMILKHVKAMYGKAMYKSELSKYPYTERDRKVFNRFAPMVQKRIAKWLRAEGREYLSNKVASDLKKMGLSQDPDNLYPERYAFDKWKEMPKGWTDKSRKQYWETMTGDVKHKVTKCIKEMTGKVGDAGAFCAALADRVEGKGWRSEKRNSSVKIAVTWKEFLDEVDYFKVAMAEGKIGNSKIKNKKLRHPKMIERDMEFFDRPDAGHDKVFFHIHMKDGQVLKGFRYDHGRRDPLFRDQLAYYIKNLKKN
jgi:hypothetical protein